MPVPEEAAVTAASSQVIIVSGNGEFMQAGYPVFNEPLTIQVVSTNGAPLAGVPVTFTVGVGQITGDPIGQLDNPNTVTDSNGLASTDFTLPKSAAGRDTRLRFHDSDREHIRGFGQFR